MGEDNGYFKSAREEEKRLREFQQCPKETG